MNNIIKIILNVLIYLIGALGMLVITCSILATLAGYGQYNIFELWNML